MVQGIYIVQETSLINDRMCEQGCVCVIKPTIDFIIGICLCIFKVDTLDIPLTLPSKSLHVIGVGFAPIFCPLFLPSELSFDVPPSKSRDLQSTYNLGVYTLSLGRV